MEAPSKRASLWAWLSVGTGLALVAAAMAIPRISDADVRVHWPPLHADVRTALPPFLLAAVVVGLALAFFAPAVLDRLSWPLAVAATTAVSYLWTMTLALTEGRDGLARVFSRVGEYRYDAQRVDDLSTMMREFIARIPLDSADHWHIHVAGHPPGALLSFVLLDRIGITSAFWLGVVMVTVGSTAVAAVMLTLKQLAGEPLARRAGIWIALAPAAVWAGVSADWYFAAVAAWGLFLLARAAATGSVPTAIAAGLLLGWCVFLSYGLVLLAIPAMAVVWATKGWRVLPSAVGGALTVTAAFWAAGFSWWAAFPVLHERYYAGIASERVYAYWVWADLAAWAFTTGLATLAAAPALLLAVRNSEAGARLVMAAVVAVGVATLSGMSKAEVERIWLPFTVWVLAAGALLPARWWRLLLVSQVATAVAVQALLLTRW